MEKVLEITFGALVELVLFGLALTVAYHWLGKFIALPRRVKVLPLQKGVVLAGDSVVKVVDAGTYWIRPSRTVIACDLRRKPFQINSQEVVTENRAVVRLSLSGECQVSDPAAFVRESSDSFSSFLLDIKQALRTSASETHSKALLSGESMLLMRMRELLVPRAAVFGVELRQLEVLEVVPSGWLENDEDDDDEED